MSAELMPIIAFLSGAMAAAVLSCLSASRASREQLEILKRGHATHGRVIHIWRPKLFGAFTRIYFEYEPAGLEGPGCEAEVLDLRIDRRRTVAPRAGHDDGRRLVHVVTEVVRRHRPDVVITNNFRDTWDNQCSALEARSP